MTMIKLTHFVNQAYKPVYLNTDQIVRVAHTTAAEQGYRTCITLTSGLQEVIETVDEVVQRISNPNLTFVPDASASLALAR